MNRREFVVGGLALSAAGMAGAASAESGPLTSVGTRVGRPAAERVLEIGESLLGVRYAAGPFGEGPLGRYDRNPLSRFDAFDCTTFVETVTALALSDSGDQFQATLNRLRYMDGEVAFTSRNHFTDLDWIPNNVRAGFYRDVTESVAPGKTLVARATIDKRAWYAKLPESRIQIPGLAETDRQELLLELRAEGVRYSPEEATVPYVPLTALFGPGGGELFDRVPSGSVVNIVRPDWDLVAQIGTHLNVSHQGFAVRKNGVLYFMEASEVLGQVSMVPLADYLRAYRDSPTIKGVNILEIAK